MAAGAAMNWDDQTQSGRLSGSSFVDDAAAPPRVKPPPIEPKMFIACKALSTGGLLRPFRPIEPSRLAPGFHPGLDSLGLSGRQKTRRTKPIANDISLLIVKC